MKPPLHPPFLPPDPILLDPTHIPNIDFHTSIINLDDLPQNSHKNLFPSSFSQNNANFSDKKFNDKNHKNDKKNNNSNTKINDLRYSRGMSWSQSHDPEAFIAIIKPLDINNHNMMVSERLNHDSNEKNDEKLDKPFKKTLCENL